MAICSKLIKKEVMEVVNLNNEVASTTAYIAKVVILIGLFSPVIAVEKIATEVDSSFNCPNSDSGRPYFYDDAKNVCVPCPYCEPGEGLSEWCGDGMGKAATCIQCVNDSFSSVYDAQKCAKCQLCPNTAQDKVPCTSKSDRTCGPCSYGYFRYPSGNDICQSCDDEESSSDYEECRRISTVGTSASQSPYPYMTNPVPTPTTDYTTVIVCSVIAIICVCGAIVFCLWCKKKAITRHRTSNTSTSNNALKSPGLTSTVVCMNGLLASDSHEASEGDNLLDPSTQDVNGQSTRQEEVTQLVRASPIPDEEPQDVKDIRRSSGSTAGDSSNSDKSDPSTQDVNGQSTRQKEVTQLVRASPIPDEEPQDVEDIRRSSGSTAGDSSNSDKSDPLASQHVRASPIRDESESSPPKEVLDEEDIRRSSVSTAGDSSYSSKSSEHRGTQTETTDRLSSDVDDMEYRKADVLAKLQQAKKCTKETYLSAMDCNDKDFLTASLHIKPELIGSVDRKTSYIDLAKLFSCDKEQIEMFKTVHDVLRYVSERDKSYPTVSDLLQKMFDSDKFVDVTRLLVEQILARNETGRKGI